MALELLQRVRVTYIESSQCLMTYIIKGELGSKAECDFERWNVHSVVVPVEAEDKQRGSEGPPLRCNSNDAPFTTVIQNSEDLGHLISSIIRHADDWTAFARIRGRLLWLWHREHIVKDL